jgi:hypothetical protein
MDKPWRFVDAPPPPRDPQWKTLQAAFGGDYRTKAERLKERGRMQNGLKAAVGVFDLDNFGKMVMGNSAPIMANGISGLAGLLGSFLAGGGDAPVEVVKEIHEIIREHSPAMPEAATGVDAHVIAELLQANMNAMGAGLSAQVERAMAAVLQQSGASHASSEAILAAVREMAERPQVAPVINNYNDNRQEHHHDNTQIHHHAAPIQNVDARQMHHHAAPVQNVDNRQHYHIAPHIDQRQVHNLDARQFHAHQHNQVLMDDFVQRPLPGSAAAAEAVYHAVRGALPASEVGSAMQLKDEAVGSAGESAANPRESFIAARVAARRQAARENAQRARVLASTARFANRLQQGTLKLRCMTAEQLKSVALLKGDINWQQFSQNPHTRGSFRRQHLVELLKHKHPEFNM